jgi:DNA-directed RNA polymerase specialized sigma24 family protein
MPDVLETPDPDGTSGEETAVPPEPPPRRAAAAAAALSYGTDPEHADYAALRADAAALVRRAGSFPEAEVADIADEAIAKLVQAAAAGRVLPESSLAYLRKIVRNEVVDRLRRRRPEPIGDEDFPDDSDDAIARMISSTSDARTIEQILRSTAQRGDTTATRVLNTYLTLAGSLRRDPTSREVAQVARVSHKTVADVLARMRYELGESVPPER